MEDEILKTISNCTPYSLVDIKRNYEASGKSFDKLIRYVDLASRANLDLDYVSFALCKSKYKPIELKQPNIFKRIFKRIIKYCGVCDE